MQLLPHRPNKEQAKILTVGVGYLLYYFNTEIVKEQYWATELSTLKQLIVCYVNFLTPSKKKVLGALKEGFINYRGGGRVFWGATL